MCINTSSRKSVLTSSATAQSQDHNDLSFAVWRVFSAALRKIGHAAVGERSTPMRKGRYAVGKRTTWHRDAVFVVRVVTIGSSGLAFCAAVNSDCVGAAECSRRNQHGSKWMLGGQLAP